MNDFHPPDLDAVATLMHGFPAPWCVAGGWALDLFLGRVTRPHVDIDLALFRADQARLRRHLAGWKFSKVANGVLIDWPEGEWLDSPVHEVHASHTAGPPSTLEFLLNEHVGDQWVFRRNRAVHCPAGRAVLRSRGRLPVLCPAVVLLYKAKQPRAVDERDFEAVWGSLGPEQREWLRTALELAHPGHAWLARLQPDPESAQPADAGDEGPGILSSRK